MFLASIPLKIYSNKFHKIKPSRELDESSTLNSQVLKGT